MPATVLLPRSGRRVAQVALAFCAGLAAGWVTLAAAKLQPCNTSTQGDRYTLTLTAATRNAASVLPSAGFQGSIANASARDAGRLSVRAFRWDGSAAGASVDRTVGVQP